MNAKKLVLPSMSQVELSLSHIDPEAAYALNQNESHAHEACEIYVNLSGDVAFEVEGRIYPISRGSVIITRPYEYHHCVFLSRCHHDHIWITFSARAYDGFLGMFFSREKGRDNLIRLDESQLGTLMELLRSLLDGEDDPLEQRIAFLQLVRILRSGTNDTLPGESARMPPDVAAALRYMDEHLTEELDIRTVAGVCNVSINTLERHFQDTFRMTPFAVLRKRRLYASMERLRNGASVAEAARESGFSDYSHYIQLFRRQFGVTPLGYKKKFRDH